MLKSLLSKFPKLRMSFAKRPKGVPAHLQNTPIKKARKKASQVFVTKDVLVVSERSPKPLAARPRPLLPKAELMAEFAKLRDAQKAADSNARSMDLAFGRSRDESEYASHVTALTPNDFLGFPEGWQDKVSPKASADKLARFERLRNSLDHYAEQFATSKVARDNFRANYAEMRLIFFQLGKNRYIPSPHDSEVW